MEKAIETRTESRKEQQIHKHGTTPFSGNIGFKIKLVELQFNVVHYNKIIQNPSAHNLSSLLGMLIGFKQDVHVKLMRFIVTCQVSCVYCALH